MFGIQRLACSVWIHCHVESLQVIKPQFSTNYYCGLSGEDRTSFSQTPCCQTILNIGKWRHACSDKYMGIRLKFSVVFQTTPRICNKNSFKPGQRQHIKHAITHAHKELLNAHNYYVLNEQMKPNNKINFYLITVDINYLAEVIQH